MHLKTIHIQHFKNYESLSLSFSPGMNCFVGDNGVGKTNLLDAIFYLSLTKSYFHSNDADVLQFGQGFFTLTGQYERNERSEEVHCAYAPDQKKTFTRNQKKYKRISEHIGFIPVVMISPSDINLIVEGSEIRRKFIDVVIAQYDKAYIHALVRYNKALKNRNALLKSQGKNASMDYDTLSLYEDIMVEESETIYAQRASFVDALAPVFEKYYQMLCAGQDEKTDLQYKSQLHEHTMRDLLEHNRQKDQILQHTSSGVHRDDLMMLLNGKAIRHFGSQGQQKTYLTALKFGKYEYIHQKQGHRPLLLLDDIFDKFDAQRVAQIIRIASGTQFGQIFITDTNKDRLDAILEKNAAEHQIFRVTHGQVHEL